MIISKTSFDCDTRRRTHTWCCTLITGIPISRDTFVVSVVGLEKAWKIGVQQKSSGATAVLGGVVARTRSGQGHTTHGRIRCAARCGGGHHIMLLLIIVDYIVSHTHTHTN